MMVNEFINRFPEGVECAVKITTPMNWPEALTVGSIVFGLFVVVATIIYAASR